MNRLVRVVAVSGMLVGLAGAVAHAEPVASPDAGSKSAGEAKPANETKSTNEAKPAGKKAHSKAEIEAFLAKCSQEADEKGLDVKKGKGAERKAYRRDCMRKFGVEPKS